MTPNSLHVASLNVRGLNDRVKRKYTFDFFKKTNFSLILLQETKTMCNNENEIRKEWHNQKAIINSTVSANCAGGCMILINDNNIQVLNTILTANGRCIVIDVEYWGSRFHVVNAYFPHETNEIRSIILSLYPLLSSQYPIIFGGDLNIAIDPKMDRYPPQNSRDTFSPELLQLVNTFDLEDVCRKFFPNQSIFTFRRGKSKSRIDFFYCSKNCMVSDYQQTDFAHSDHDILSMSIKNQNTFLKGKGFWRNRTKIYASENFIKKFKVCWERILKTNWKRFTGSWWVETKFQIKKFLIKLNSETDDDQNEEIQNLKINLERKRFLTTIFPSSEIANKNYFECKKELAKKQINVVKEKIIHDQITDLNFGDMPTKAFFEKLKRLKSNKEPYEVYNKNGGVEKNAIKIVHIAKEFIEKKFGKPQRVNTQFVLM